ncbi:MAG TPA: succinate dehydrogenase [Alphaproteobacteria bacterium]|nr:succinate dehydrogenase [Alphaproteobacteria bacterium]
MRTTDASVRHETWLWLAQRASALVLAGCVLIHLVTIVLAVRGGLNAAEILGRTRGDLGWLAFYSIFVLAVAIHAPIGLRAIVREMTPWRGRSLDIVAAVAAVSLAWFGWRAIGGLFV